MELRDLIVTPLLVILVYVLAYIVRPHVTDGLTRKYFIPALTVRILGAVALGFIYQFYYRGGDTFNYHTYGSRIIWNALFDDPSKAVKLFFSDGTDYTQIYTYASQLRMLGDPQSYAVIQLAALFDVLTFSSYSGTAVLFAVFAMTGAWSLFTVFYRMYPSVHKLLAAATLFIPSVIFWGSGILKDTITLSCLGILTYGVCHVFILKSWNIRALLWIVLPFYLIAAIKPYITMVFIPAVVVWIFFSYVGQLRKLALRLTLIPFAIIAIATTAYYGVVKASETNPRYSLANFAETARITAYDIRYYTGRDAGSGYTLGELDGTWESVLRLAPAAVNVSLFRPYPWEVQNILMVLSSLESLVILLLTVFLIIRNHIYLRNAISNPDVLFSFVFSIVFAFAVGVSTYNFGTLTRYKIPLMPFYLIALILLDYHSRAKKKLMR